MTNDDRHLPCYGLMSNFTRFRLYDFEAHSLKNDEKNTTGASYFITSWIKALTYSLLTALKP